MREDGFYWTGYDDGTLCLEVRQSVFGRWMTCGLTGTRGSDTFVVLSGRLLPPTTASGSIAIPPKPKSGMTAAERELLLATARWVVGSDNGCDLVRMALSHIEAEGK